MSISLVCEFEGAIINNLLLTGATGFVGKSIRKKSLGAVVLGRSCPVGCQGKTEGECIKRELSANEDYDGCFENIDVVIHCAARVHVMNEKSIDPLQAFREVNVEGTLNLAKQAAAAGVKRFIFISSIKVNGEGTDINVKYTSSDQAAPEDAYGTSKFEAEQCLINLSKGTEMEVVIIRPPLVYGPGVNGNFLTLLKLSKLPIPLPFGLINNKRSMVYLDNLVDLIITCIDHPNAKNKIFLASDNDDLSLTRLLILIRKAMNKLPLLLPIPMILFKLLGVLFGKSTIVDRLIGNLQVDSDDAKKYLNWSAPYTVEQGIKATVDDFLKNSQ